MELFKPPDFGEVESESATTKAINTQAEFETQAGIPLEQASTEQFGFEILQDEKTTKKKRVDHSQFSSTEFNEVDNLLTNVEEYSKRIRDDVDRYARQVREEVDLLKSEIELELANVLIAKKKAEVEGKEIIKSAEESRDQILQKGKEEGFQAGLVEGAQQYKEENELNTKNVISLLKDLKDLRTNINKDHEQQIVRLCTLIAKKVVHHELKTEKDLVLRILKETMHHFEGMGNVRIRLHPTEYDFIAAHQEELSTFLDEKQMIVLTRDANISPATSSIESDFSSIDLDLNKQFEEIEQKLRDCNDDRKPLFQT